VDILTLKIIALGNVFSAFFASPASSIAYLKPRKERAIPDKGIVNKIVFKLGP